MEGINWKRGALRVWVVVSVLWLAAAVSFAISTDVFNVQPIPVYEITGPSNKVYNLTENVVACITGSLTDINDISRTGEIDKMTEQLTQLLAPPEMKACFKKGVAHHGRKETQRRLMMAAVIASPPIVLLLIGFVVVWVARGFKAG